MEIYMTSPDKIECPRCGNTYEVSDLRLPVESGAKSTIICEACGYQVEVIVKLEPKQRRIRRWLFFWRVITEYGRPEYLTCFRPVQGNLFEGEE